jgi:predicted metal-dependent hydrolase
MGLSEARASHDAGALGRYYAEAAHLEAAAVVAFEVMVEELEHFGAPAELVARAKRAQSDEIRHAARMSALARRYGAKVPPLDVAPARRRSLLDMALENAVEGCVRETWAALSAHWQAAMAADPEARRIWREVAIDESEHGELSLAVHDWIAQRLSGEQRALVTAAKERAASDLVRALENEPEPELVSVAGLPSRAVAEKLSRALREQLWTRV